MQEALVPSTAMPKYKIVTETGSAEPGTQRQDTLRLLQEAGGDPGPSSDRGRKQAVRGGLFTFLPSHLLNAY